MVIEKGNKIKVEYTGTMDDGTVFDSTEKQGGKPLEFEVGSGQVIKGFENALIGMDKGEEKEITLEPAEAYGHPNDELLKKVPKDKLPKEQEPKPGMMLLMGLPNGSHVPAKIKEVDEENVTIDLNHPLAGKTLNFKLKVVDIN
ncbi:peptidylprolyl isomerase [Candidatus Woesearchaeota archaeon]|nr:peptidylprolyl isomerase [Candidatus Woesearchaeota archaeon]